jgi:CRP-like cAMP-binding protein
MQTGAPKDRTGNLLLDALAGDQSERLMAHAEKRGIDIGVALIEPEGTIESVFFPTQGTLSVLAVPEADRRVEAATVGREGAADVFAALGSRIAVHELIGQVPGEMIVIDADTVVREASSPGRFQDLIHGYIQAFFAQTAYAAACNAVHHIDNRAARWLLMTHDRMDEDTFLLKQEFLAIMLGVHRPTVSIAAGALKNAGLIDYSRGVVTVKDRFGLEEAACPCYENTRTAYSRLVHL